MLVANLFPKPSLAERSALVRILNRETVGGALMLGASLLALLWANSPLADSYGAMRELTFGSKRLHLYMDLAHWIQDGLLAIFFAVAGLELRREFTHGDLKNPRNAVLPIAAAIGGMAMPAVIYLAIAHGDASARSGWAIPMATDIAFALAVLAVVGRNLPSSLRAFLLTLAIVDDVIAILIIATFFTEKISLIPLLGSLLFLALYGVTQRIGMSRWFVALPLAIGAWGTLHASGIHATVAGVAVGLLTSNKSRRGRSAEERYDDALRPLSAGIVVPLFALVSAGVVINSDFISALVDDRAALGVMAGLVLGKILGITGVTYLVARFTRAELNSEIKWIDVFGISCVAGIGFTVSLLITSLTFGTSERTERVIAAVLVGSLISAVLAAVVLFSRNLQLRHQ